MRIHGLLALGIGSALVLAGPAAAQDGQCHLQQIAELKVAFERNRPVIDAEVNGLKVKLLLDTGSGHTTLFTDVIARAGSHALETHGSLYGVGGSRVAKAATIDTFSFGGATMHGLRLSAIDRDPSRQTDIAGFIGADLFSQTEAEFDLSQGMIRLFKAQDCAGQSLAYWAPTSDQAQLVGGALASLVGIQLNGRPARARIDTGATRSVVTSEAATRTGAETVANAGTGHSFGIGQEAVDTKVAAFDSFAIGGETIRNVRLTVGDLFGRDTTVSAGSRVAQSAIDFPDMLLGGDFFRTHRVLISQSQRKLYFTYSGGVVFPPPPPPRHPEATLLIPPSAPPPPTPPSPPPGLH